VNIVYATKKIRPDQVTGTSPRAASSVLAARKDERPAAPDEADPRDERQRQDERSGETERQGRVSPICRRPRHTHVVNRAESGPEPPSTQSVVQRMSTMATTSSTRPMTRYTGRIDSPPAADEIHCPSDTGSERQGQIQRVREHSHGGVGA